MKKQKTKSLKRKQTKTQKILNRILINQRNMMIWMNGESSIRPYYEGYFANNIKHTEELIE